MDALAELIGRAKLGPVPLPYILVVALFPIWTSFSSHENSLLFSMFIIITVTIKGSLFSCWIMYRVTPWILQGALVSGVMIAQMIVLQFSLHSSIFFLILLVPPSTFTGICILKLHLWNQGDDKCEDPVHSQSSRKVIGIFSRSAPEEYAWLASMLNRLGRVVSFSITNSNSLQFRQQVNQCTFAILYHSKTRGRLNITDVTDSLYDDELEYMSQELGRNKVIVVADDIDDSSPIAENNILSSQPSIAKLACSIYLFTKKEKMDDRLVKDKVQPICNKISQGSTVDIVCDLVMFFLVFVPWLYFIYSICHVYFLITTNLNGSFLVYFRIYSPNHHSFVLPSSHPILQRNRTRVKSKDSRMVGRAVVLILMVIELYFLTSVTSSMNMVLLITQSLGTGAFILKKSMS